MAKLQFIQARALSAVAGCGVACNDILEGPPATLAALAAAGFVDIDPSAVAYAQAQGARVVTLVDPDGAAELAQSAAPEAPGAVAQSVMPEAPGAVAQSVMPAAPGAVAP